MRSIDFYYDPISPYAWLAFYGLDDLKKRHKISVNPIPVLFGALLSGTDNKGPAEVDNKRRLYWLDVARWTQHYKVEFESPPSHPFNPLLALRVSACIEDNELHYAVAKEICETAWREGKDITSIEVVSEILERQGLDSKAIITQANSAEIKALVKENTDRAIKRGVFGVPTFFVGDEIFWGQDRLNFLEDYLNTGKAVDREECDQKLARPRGIDRPFWVRQTFSSLIDRCLAAGVDARNYLEYATSRYLRKKEILTPERFNREHPVKISGVAHTILSVSDFSKSRSFYSPLLTYLGLNKVFDGEEFLYFVGKETAVGIMPCASKYKGEVFDQTRPGLHHLCFMARDRNTIDELHSFLQTAEAKIVHGPEDGPWAKGYYSILFEDPDGIRLEVNHWSMLPGQKFDPAGDYN